jgi:hypothetical protein
MQKEIQFVSRGSHFMSASENTSARARSVAIIRRLVLPGRERSARFFSLLILAWLASAVVHVVVLLLLSLITLAGRAEGTGQQEVRTLVDEGPDTKANLIDDELGLNPGVLLNYNINRIEDIAVPGPTLPADPVGLKDAAAGLPVNIPPPPGLGDNSGQGGGLDLIKPDATANPVGSAGGMGGINVPGGFGGRSGATKEKLLLEGGGNSASEAAVAAGQKWLVQHQAADGHWSLNAFDQHQGGRCNCTGFGQDNDIAGTALGLLPLLGAGETHRNSRSTYRNNVEKALRFLVKKQARNGYFGGSAYGHALAAIAVCEAYGLTADPALRGPAQRSIQYIRDAQSENGGWRYEPREGGDTSVTGWMVMALKSAQMSGLEVDDAKIPTFNRASRFLGSVMTPDGGGYGYQGPDPTPTMTAVGALCRLYLGLGPRNSGVVAGVNRLRRSAPSKKLDNIYYYYYATQVMHHVGGEAWEAWNPLMRDMLVATQDKGTTAGRSHLKGSWSPDADKYGGSGGRLMETSLAVLTLEVYYRHLPLYRRGLGENKITAGN